MEGPYETGCPDASTHAQRRSTQHDEQRAVPPVTTTSRRVAIMAGRRSASSAFAYGELRRLSFVCIGRHSRTIDSFILHSFQRRSINPVTHTWYHIYQLPDTTGTCGLSYIERQGATPHEFQAPYLQAIYLPVAEVSTANLKDLLVLYNAYCLLFVRLGADWPSAYCQYKYTGSILILDEITSSLVSMILDHTLW